ncbi:hypothetical protein [Winogradskyella sp. 4-2091]|uniref:hypothetical protein n=1 Tax=Winogradskyella sp. 4-2091 TaxID=3381659 RepID=UPI003891A6DB
MFTPTLRLIFVIIGIITAIFFYTEAMYSNMVMMLIASALFVYGYYKSGTVYAAFQQLKKQNFKKAEALISMIKNPDRLSKGQKSYYYFSKGIIDSEKEDWDNAYTNLIEANRIGLRTKNDTSIVLLNLANVEFERKNYASAVNYIKHTKEFKLQPLIKTELDKLEKAINSVQG